MRQAGVNLREVMDALAGSNINVGGKVIEENGMEFVVRGIGLVNSLDDLRRIAVRTHEGLPIYLEDIAEISIGGDFRRGALDVDGREVVGGVVVMRTGENAMQVIQRVKEKIAQIAPSLPKGVTIVPFYDRSGLIERTIDTLRHCAHRGDPARHVGPYHFSLALSQHPDRYPSPADLHSHFVHPDGGIRHHVEHHVAVRHRHCDRRARRCGHRHDRKRDPALRTG
jgi:hypothetical protein